MTLKYISTSILVGFEVLMVVKINISVLWDVTPCSLVDRYKLLEEHTSSILRVEDAGSRFLWNIGTYVPSYTVTS
jgi:hypothetical protein